MTIDPPLGLLAELTHRCPLGCLYCSNPERLVPRAAELPTDVWKRVLDEAAALGVLQIHLSGGEPLLRADLPAIVAHASSAGLYTTLATSGLGLTEKWAIELARAGLDHVQLSVQSLTPALAKDIGRLERALPAKWSAARAITHAGLPLTLNVVLHRLNVHELPRFVDMALALGAERLELAHVQFQGWAWVNRGALLPTFDEVEHAASAVREARERVKGALVIDYVEPDFHAVRPKTCMGGWGRLFLVVTPEGNVLPCHGAERISTLSFENVAERSLDVIWRTSEAFQRFRGTSWMPEPCRSCPEKEQDFGGCRCQALAITGCAEATDPTCDRAPHRDRLVALHLAPKPATLHHRRMHPRRLSDR